MNSGLIRAGASAIPLLAAVATIDAYALVIAPEFASSYTVEDLGQPPGVPGRLGGLTAKLGDPDTLLIGGAANTISGRLYEVPVIRDSEGLLQSSLE